MMVVFFNKEGKVDDEPLPSVPFPFRAESISMQVSEHSQYNLDSFEAQEEGTAKEESQVKKLNQNDVQGATMNITNTLLESIPEKSFQEEEKVEDEVNQVQVVDRKAKSRRPPPLQIVEFQGSTFRSLEEGYVRRARYLDNNKDPPPPSTPNTQKSQDMMYLDNDKPPPEPQTPQTHKADDSSSVSTLENPSTIFMSNFKAARSRESDGSDSADYPILKNGDNVYCCGSWYSKKWITLWVIIAAWIVVVVAALSVTLPIVFHNSRIQESTDSQPDSSTQEKMARDQDNTNIIVVPTNENQENTTDTIYISNTSNSTLNIQNISLYNDTVFENLTQIVFPRFDDFQSLDQPFADELAALIRTNMEDHLHGSVSAPDEIVGD